MTVARVGALTVTSPVPAPLVRLGAITVTGSTAGAPRVRLGAVAVSGTAAVIVVPPPGRTLGPGESLVLTAALADGSAADTWSWRRVSGPTVTLVGAGASRTVVAPSVMPPGDTLVLGVTATVGAVVSVEQLVQIPLLPQLAWSYDGTGWVGARTVPA